jgi:hypothetical protein
VSWHFQPNDDTLGGWLATGVYAVLVILCWRETFRRAPPGKALQRPFWICLSLAVTAVGINKQLDLQSLMRDLGRYATQTEGLMRYRRLIQAAFAATAAIAAAILSRVLWRLSTRALPSERLVIFGIFGLIGFVVLRIAMFSHIDILTGQMAQHRPILALELAVVAFLCFAVWRNGQTDSSRRSTR